MTELDLTASQRNFLRLHVKHMVDAWRWHFGKTQLRAHASRRRATIWTDELDDLIARGLMVRGAGEADVYVTMTGKESIS